MARGSVSARTDNENAQGSLGFAAANTSNWNARDPRIAYGQMSRSLRSYRSKGARGRAAQSSDFFEGVKEAESPEPAPPGSDTKEKNTKEKGKLRRWLLQ
jgi:hypothetical protein